MRNVTTCRVSVILDGLGMTAPDPLAVQLASETQPRPVPRVSLLRLSPLNSSSSILPAVAVEMEFAAQEFAFAMRFGPDYLARFLCAPTTAPITESALLSLPHLPLRLERQSALALKVGMALTAPSPSARRVAMEMVYA